MLPVAASMRTVCVSRLSFPVKYFTTGSSRKCYEPLNFLDLRGDLIFFALLARSGSPLGKRAVPCSLPIVLTYHLARLGLRLARPKKAPVRSASLRKVPLRLACMRKAPLRLALLRLASSREASPNSVDRWGHQARVSRDFSTAM